MEMVPAIKNVMVTLFKKMAVEKKCYISSMRRPITCIIANAAIAFPDEFPQEKGIPLIYFLFIGACSYWACYFFAELIEADEIPVKGNGMYLLVKSVPGIEGFLRKRDLPRYSCVDDINDPIFHAQLKSRLAKIIRTSLVSSESFWNTDSAYMDWLNSQPPKTVIYVSSGSITVVSRDQLMEFWYDLVNSGERFLWIMRPGSIDYHFLVLTKQKG